MRIKDWGKFQHFKDRRPPWIKLYRDLLDDEEYYNLPAQSAKVLTLLWLLASEDPSKQGLLPSVQKIAFRLRLSEKSIESIVSDLHHWVIQDDIKPSSEQYHSGPSELETKAELKTEERQNDFEVFWNAYPKKAGKKAAIKAWEKAKDKPNVVDMVQAIEKFKKSPQWMKENGQFIPHPSTWLNEGRWADEVVSVESEMQAQARMFLGRG